MAHISNTGAPQHHSLTLLQTTHTDTQIQEALVVAPQTEQTTSKVPQHGIVAYSLVLVASLRTAVSGGREWLPGGNEVRSRACVACWFVAGGLALTWFTFDAVAPWVPGLLQAHCRCDMSHSYGSGGVACVSCETYCH